MKNFISTLVAVLFVISGFGQNKTTISLTQPNIEKGNSVLKALSERASANDFDPEKLQLQDLSDLLWAANGINRPDEGKRTAPSAMNAQDIDIYVFLEEAVYLYNAKEHSLHLIAEGDHRKLIAGSQEYVAKAPVICLLVSDISRFRSGSEDAKLTWAKMDAGIVSQNISLFCASVKMKTRPRVSMDQDKLRELLQLKESQHLMLNHPVSY